MRRNQGERAIPISGDPTLEGLYVRGLGENPKGACIAPPHPLLGGSMDSPIVNEMAYACAKAEIASVRFNWRGVGASGGVVTGNEEAAMEDFEMAAREISETVSSDLIWMGYSFGAVIAARSAPVWDRVQRLVLVSPPHDLCPIEILQKFEGDILIVVGELDEFSNASILREITRELTHLDFEVLPKTDHFFSFGLGQLGALLFDWLSKGIDSK